ncbi:MAG: sensor histidine kinase [Rhizobiaceae bacterium]|nr:sensor histidine kinase [Rhizobiaceae bacterium]
MLLLRSDGQQLLNTRVPFGTELPRTSDLDALAASLEDDDIYFSDIFFGKVSQKWVFNVMLPLPFQIQSQAAVLLITMNAEDMASVVAVQDLPSGWSSAVLDSEDKIVASAGANPMQSGSDLPLTRAEIGTWAESRYIGDLLLGAAPVRTIGWTTVLWGPAKTARTPIFENQMPLLLGGALLLLCAAFSAWLLGTKIRSSVARLADEAHKIGGGSVAAPVSTPINELNEVSVALAEASLNRHKAEERLKILVSELSHRTKNIMTVIDVMIRQTARTQSASSEYVKALRERLHGLATSIDLLARDKWAGVPFKSMALEHLGKFLYTPGQLMLSGEDFVVKPGAVQPLSLAIHELGTNAMKYGALSVPTGRVRLAWIVDREMNPASITITWREENGPAVSVPETKGFGSTVTGAHVAASLNSQVDVEYNTDGLSWSIKGPFGAFSDDDSGSQ